MSLSLLGRTMAANSSEARIWTCSHVARCFIFTGAWVVLAPRSYMVLSRREKFGACVWFIGISISDAEFACAIFTMMYCSLIQSYLSSNELCFLGLSFLWRTVLQVNGFSSLPVKLVMDPINYRSRSYALVPWPVRRSVCSIAHLLLYLIDCLIVGVGSLPLYFVAWLLFSFLKDC